MSHSNLTQAEALSAHGRELVDSGKFLVARPTLEQALALWRQLGIPRGVAQTLLDLGHVAAGLGETRRAIGHYEEAQTFFHDLDDQEGEGAALYGMGKVHMNAGDSQAALPLFAQAFPLLRGTPSWTEEVAQMAGLADTMTVAQSLFDTLQKRPRSAPFDFGAIAATLQSQAEAGSDTAARLFAGVNHMAEGIASAMESLGPRGRLKYHLTALASADSRERISAARGLALSRMTEAVEPLFAALETERDPVVLQELIMTLRAYGKEEFIPRLRPWLQHPEARVRLAVVLALVDLGEPGLEQALLAGLESEDARLRAQVVQLLEKRADPALADLLLPLLRDRDPKVRTKAVYAVGALRDPRAIDELIAATRDRYQVVRWAAVRVLGDMGDVRAIDALIAALGDSNRDIRRSAATSLGKIKDPRAAPALTRALTDEWFRVAESARAALRKLKSPPSLEALLSQLADPERAKRRAAVELLGAQGQQDAIPALRRRLTADPDMDVRLAAARALASLKDHAALPFILDMLKSAEPVARITLIEALGALGDATAEPALIDLLGERHPYIRHAAIQALADIGTRASLPALAAIQVRDEDTVAIGNGFNHVSLKTAASIAAERIRAREILGGADTRN